MSESVGIPVEDDGRRAAAERARVAWVSVRGERVHVVAAVIVDLP